MASEQSPQFHYSNHFIDSAHHLAAVDAEAWAGLSASVLYLNNFGRSALAPDIQWHLKQSVFGQNSGEIRWPDPERQRQYPNAAWRGLFVVATDLSWVIFTLLGNKAAQHSSSNIWYDRAVAISDDIARRAKNDLQLNMFPIEV